MIINALNRYYEILVEDEKSGIPLEGYSSAKVGFALVISDEGKLVDVINLKVEGGKGKKLIPRILTVPEQKIRSSGIASNFMCDNSTYVLGVDNKGKPERTKEAFEAFKDLHNKVLGSATGRCARAILNFVNMWNHLEAETHKTLKSYLDEIKEGSNIVFRLDGEKDFTHNDEEIRRNWELFNTKAGDDVCGQCLINGEKAVIAKLHPPIKNVKNAQSSGASIVSFNAKAYESYGKENGYIAPISKRATFAYTTTLNHMLSNPKQKVQIGDATTVFWAESPEDIYVDLAAEFFNPIYIQDGKENKNSYRRDLQIEELVKDVLVKTKSGDKFNEVNEKINSKTKFYVLGLSPNASRISIRFFQTDSFGGFIEKTLQHYKDMDIIKEFKNQPDNIPIWKILAETVPPESREKASTPILGGALMRSILSGGLYPQSLYSSIIQRVKSDSAKRVDYLRASIIKAYLSRKGRITKNKLLEEVVTVALNEQTTEKSYLLGRLFAILEKTQIDAGNETIRARYFTSAMTTPGATFPILLRLAQHHIAKAEFGFVNDKKIEGVLNEVEGFPAHLNLDEQGLFTLGYYQQRVKLWEKKAKENNNFEEEK